MRARLRGSATLQAFGMFHVEHTPCPMGLAPRNWRVALLRNRCRKALVTDPWLRLFQYYRNASTVARKRNPPGVWDVPRGTRTMPNGASPAKLEGCAPAQPLSSALVTDPWLRLFQYYRNPSTVARERNPPGVWDVPRGAHTMPNGASPAKLEGGAPAQPLSSGLVQTHG